MEENKKALITNRIFQIIYFLGYIFLTLFIVASLVEAKISDNNYIPQPDEIVIQSYGIVLAIVGIIFGGMFYGLLLVMGIINIIVAGTRKNNPKRSKIVLLSSISIILPIVSYALIIIIGLIAQ